LCSVCNKNIQGFDDELDVLVIPLHCEIQQGQYQDDISSEAVPLEVAMKAYNSNVFVTDYAKWRDLDEEKKKYWARRTHKLEETRQHNFLLNSQYKQFLCNKCSTCSCNKMAIDNFQYDSEFPFYCRQCPICLKIKCKNCKINDRCVDCYRKDCEPLIYNHVMSTLMPIFNIKGLCSIVSMYICNVDVDTRGKKRKKS
jgi:hypothetical protein